MLLALAVFGACRCGDGLLRGRALASALEHRTDLEFEGGALVVRASETASYRLIEGEAERAIWIETPKGRLEVAWDLFDAGVDAPLADLGAILAHVASLEGVRAVHDVLLERLVIRSPDGGICDASGCAAALDADPRAIEERLVEIERAAAELDTDGLELATSALEALRESLSWLALADDQISGDQFTLPSFVRRMVRHDWLRAIGIEDVDVRDAVLSAEQYETIRRIPLADGTVFELANAFGAELRTYRSLAERTSRYELALPRPAYFAEFPRLRLVVEVAGDDPFDARAELRSARVWQEWVPLAQWTPEAGFVADAEAWRARVQSAPVLLAEGTLPGAIPPHVLIVDPMGDVRALATAHGTLVPRDGADPASREAFLAEAARTLPDAAHLDLLGEYLYGYANDGPDPSRPLLIGTPSSIGDIHQTVAQTLETFTGGMYRGDCDDLSELYEDIATRQGRNAHMIGLPAHAALAFSEERDGAWWTYVLQTGVPQGVRGDTLRESIERTYRLFDAQAAVNPEQVEILLRFSGENTRDTYHLSYRIFGEPEYARIMLDIQEDWHRFTFSPAIEKMRALLDAGDTTPANLREYASLLESTGQYAAAAEELERTLALSTAPIDRIQVGTQRVSNLFYAGRPEPARELARTIFEAWIPELEVGDEAERIDLYVQLANVLMDRDYANDLALEVVSGGIRPIIDAREFWYQSMEERFRLDTAMDSAIEVLRKTGRSAARSSDEWQELSVLVRLWIETCAFSIPDPSQSVLGPYAKLGRYLEALEGPVDYREKLLEMPPPDAAREHEERSAEEGVRDALDAQWVSLAPRYWWTALADAVDDAREGIDRKEILFLAHRTRVALAQAEERGLARPGFASLRIQSEIVSAIAAGNDARLRDALAVVDARGDRELREDAAGWIAALGARLPEAELARLVETTFTALPQPQLYFRIAWRIARRNPSAGVAVAKRAAERAKTLPELAREHAFMRELVARGGIAPPARLTTGLESPGT